MSDVFGSGGSVQTQSSNTPAPWAGVAPYLSQGLSSAASLYNSNPGGFNWNPNAAQTQGFNSGIAAATNPIPTWIQNQGISDTNFTYIIGQNATNFAASLITTNFGNGASATSGNNPGNGATASIVISTGGNAHGNGQTGGNGLSVMLAGGGSSISGSSGVGGNGGTVYLASPGAGTAASGAAGQVNSGNITLYPGAAYNGSATGISNVPPSGISAGNLPATVTNTGPLTATPLLQVTNISVSAATNQGAADTNFTLATGLGGTNLTLAIGLGNTNFTLLVGLSNSNLSYTIGSSNTNNTMVYSNTANNNLIGGSNSIITALGLTNSQIISALAAGTNAVIGALISTNNQTLTALAAGTNAAQAAAILRETTLSNNVLLVTIQNTNGTAQNITETTNHTLSHWDYNTAQGIDASTNTIDTWGGGIEQLRGHYIALTSGVMTNTRWNGTALVWQNPAWFWQSAGTNCYSITGASSITNGSTVNIANSSPAPVPKYAVVGTNYVPGPFGGDITGLEGMTVYKDLRVGSNGTIGGNLTLGGSLNVSANFAIPGTLTNNTTGNAATATVASNTSNTEYTSHAPSYTNMIFCAGDSITAGNSYTGPSNVLAYPLFLASDSGWITTNWGAAGQSSSSYRATYSAGSVWFKSPTIIEIGVNDHTQGETDTAWTNTCMTNINWYVTNLTGLGNSNFIVWGIPTGTNEPVGNSTHDVITNFNGMLQSVYGSHYFDSHAVLLTNYNPQNSQDVIDVANDVIPYSLRNHSKSKDTNHQNN